MNVAASSLRSAACLLALLAPAWAGAAMRVLVVSGIGGEAAYDERFAQWSEQVAQASATATSDAARVQRLSGNDATRAKI